MRGRVPLLEASAGGAGRRDRPPGYRPGKQDGFGNEGGSRPSVSAPPPKQGGRRGGTPADESLPIQVKHIMQRPPVIVRDDDPLERVARAMIAGGAACAAVVDQADRLVGVIRDEDFGLQASHFPFSTELVFKLFGEWVEPERLELDYQSVRVRPARTVMGPPTGVIGEGARLFEALVGLRQGRSLLVVRGTEPVGTLSRHDVLKLVAGD
jgi:CBS domain-containing protein